MEKYYGNYLGIVVNSNDPEYRNRLQVWIPNLSNTLYLNWNDKLEDKTQKFGFDDPDILERLTNSLPWAECASPLFGGGTSMRINPSVENQPTGSSYKVPVEINTSGDTSNEPLDLMDDNQLTDSGGRNVIELIGGGYVYEDGTDLSKYEIDNLNKKDNIGFFDPVTSVYDVDINKTVPDDENRIQNDAPEAAVTVETSNDSQANVVASKTPEIVKIVSPITGTIAGNSGSLYSADRNGGSRCHSGIDWQAPDGSEVREMVGGTVIYNGYNQGYDANIVVHGDDGIIRRYATHGTTINVPTNTRIEKGDIIGTIAKRHLHYEEIAPTAIDSSVNQKHVEFLNNKNSNIFTSTSNCDGTRDPIAYNNFVAGTNVQAGVAIGENVTTNIAAQSLENNTGESNVVDTPKLPIASNGTPSPDGQAKGIISSPSLGAKVWVFFYGGDIQKPVYFANAISPEDYGQALGKA